MFLLLLLLWVLCPIAVTDATTCAVPWSTDFPLLNSSGEAAPWTRCDAFQSLYGCHHKNFCCYDSQIGCFPSNPAFLECPGLSQTDCWAASDATCWWDGQMCRRNCPPGLNATVGPQDLCAALDVQKQPQPWSNFLAFNADEWAPGRQCADFATEQGCKIQNYCCWDGSSNTCIPSNEQRIECPGKSQDSCMTWSPLCTWNADTGVCQRLLPLTADPIGYCANVVQLWAKPRNILMIIVDDLRPELHLAYGQNQAITPNLDAFAVRPGALTFDRVYSNFPICSPSRTSFLSGRSPDSTGVLNQEGQLRSTPASQNFVTMPQLFKNNGFYSTGGGKVYHLNHDDPKSWNSYFFENVDQGNGCTNDPNAKPIMMRNGQVFTPQWAVCTSSSGPEKFLDYTLLFSAQNTLKSLAQSNNPFFMAVGFFRPHIP